MVRTGTRILAWLLTYWFMGPGGGICAAETIFPLRLAAYMDGLPAGGHLEILEDAERALTVEDLERPEVDGRFQPVGAISSRGLSRSAWWLKLQVINPEPTAVTWYIQTLSPTLDYVDAYHRVPGRVIPPVRLGDRRPIANQIVPFEVPIIPLVSHPHEKSTVYIRLAFEEVGFVDAEVWIWTPEAFSLHRDRNNLGVGLYLGGLFFMTVYNLFLYFATRMREYFWYVAYVGGYAIATTALMGLGHRYLYADSVWLTEFVPTLAIQISLIIGLQFNRVFLESARLAPRMDRLMRFYMLVMLGTIGLVLFGFKAVSLLTVLLLTIPMLPSMPIIGISLWLRGQDRARFLILGWCFLLLGFAVSMARIYGYFPTQFLSLWAGRLGLWMEALFLSLALVDHINILRREKELASQRENEAIRRVKSELEARVLERTHDLEAARKRADDANQAKSLFLANMSHEIRTPMNAIMGLSHLVLQDDAPDRRRQHLEVIQNASHALLGIIDDILDFSRIEAGELRIEWIDFSLHAVIDEIVLLMIPKADEKGLIFDHELPDGEWVLHGDPLRLRQVLLNLVANAIKFTPRGAVRLAVEPVETGAGDEDGRWMRFRVIDQGIGIAPEELGKLFKPFQQGDISHARQHGGTGLGLAICERLVTAMGGRIHVTSAAGEGSTFTVLLPWSRGLLVGDGEVGERRLSVRPGVAWKPEARDLARLRGARVLLVDDVALNCQIARAFLEGYGIEVSVAGSGQRAVELAVLESFDLILMDIQMPGMNGLEATRAIRNLPGREAWPILAMTAHAMAEDRLACLEAGMNDHLAKPLEPERFFSKLVEWLPEREMDGDPGVLERRGEEPDGEEIALPGIDWRRALRLVHGNRRLLRHSLDAFAADYRVVPDELRGELLRGGLARLKPKVHALKGLSGNLGMLDLGARARELDAALARGVAGEVEVEGVARELERILDGLAGLPPLPPPEGAGRGVGGIDPEAFERCCRELIRLLEIGDFRASELLPALAGALAGHEGSLFTRLESRVAAFANEEALAILEAMRWAVRERFKGEGHEESEA
ncbi:7TM diverse intracellular signaling domain-containing protein [Candidatus Magnetaquiglobus chichijimensis]|uniref:hybrid sensor histidine kinase/response regulator n=1 Tax=Candidatus Magnetaquiglobus chichijimensis TaxID=3141448 RepID=UPI003B970962